MIILIEQIQSMVIEAGSSIKDTLKKINENACGVCFILKDQILVGVATDGDIRRFMLSGGGLNQSIDTCMNRKFVFNNINDDKLEIRKNLNEKIRYLPLLNNQNKLIGVAHTNVISKIPILEPYFIGNELYYVEDCLRSNWISSQGEYVKKFEQQFSEMHECFNAVSTSNGTTALHLALLALGIGPGDEVIVPNITFAASANAVLYCNATPVLCEIDHITWCINTNEIEKLITTKTKAIMPVHLYGQVCDINGIKKIADKNNLFIIEDCAEALGSKYKNKRVGLFGDAAIFSFFGNKTISTGEGGMIIFPKREVADKARVLRDHGMNPNKRYWHDSIGFNYRLTNMQAAVGVAQLEKFDIIINKKNEIFNYYLSNLKDVDEIEALPHVDTEVFNSNWLFTILLSSRINRSELIKRMAADGIELRPAFFMLSEMPPYTKFKKSKTFKVSESLSQQGVSLPSSASLSINSLDKIVYSLKRCLKV